MENLKELKRIIEHLIKKNYINQKIADALSIDKSIVSRIRNDKVTISEALSLEYIIKLKYHFKDVLQDLSMIKTPKSMEEILEAISIDVLETRQDIEKVKEMLNQIISK